MLRTPGAFWVSSIAVTLAACSSPGLSTQDATPDSGIRVDTGVRDSGSGDLGVSDLGVSDLGVTDLGTNDAMADAGVIDGAEPDGAESDAAPIDAEVDAGDPDGGADAALPFLEVLGNGVVHTGPGVADLLVTATGSISVVHTPGNGNVAISDLVNGTWVQRAPLVASGPLTGSAVQLVNSADGLVVAYLVNPGTGTSIVTLVYDGAAWQPKTVPVTGTIFGTEAAFDLVLDLQSRALLVLVEGGSLQTYRYESGAWAPLGAPFHSAVATVRARLQANGSLLVAGQFSLPPFGSGVFAAQQTAAGAWSFIGPMPIDAIGDTTQQIQIGEIVEGVTGWLMSWNKGTCNQMPRYTAQLETTTTAVALQNAGDIGYHPRLALLGSELIAIYQPDCAGSALAVRRLSGSSWGPEIPFGVAATEAQLLVRGGQLYVLWWNGHGSQANVGRLNVP